MADPQHSPKQVTGSAQDAADRLIAEGNRAEDGGDPAAACALYRRATELAPRYARAHINLGVGLEAAGNAAAAIAAYEQALVADPPNPAASYNLGKLLYSRGELAKAERLLQQALSSRPDFPDARLVYSYVRAERFHVLETQGDLAAAVVELEAVLALRPDWTQALYNYGTTLMKLGRDGDAEAALRRVIAREPGFVLAYRMLGNLLHRHGRVRELIEICRAGRNCLPEDFDLESFELLELNFVDDLAEDAMARAHRAFGARLERAFPPGFALPRERAARERKLRVGYVSSDLSYHPVGLFMLPVIERHDRNRFEVHCYATSTKSDDFTRRLSSRSDAWRDAHALSDAQLAQLVHDDRIDILVDLAGHSGVSRLATFAQQPAPVQVSWLGYLNTTGLSRIQYRITDRHCDPAGLTEHLHTERLVRLPNAQWCYRPFVSVTHAPVPPLQSNGHVTFGSFNQIAKISRTTLVLWERILNGVADSRLVVAGVADERSAAGLLGELAAAGIARKRITVVPFAPVQDYLRWYDSVDIALDPTPYSGGTTTCDALWMGVPVVTMPGPRPASRSAASILSTVGLREWIAQSPDDYVRLAVGFARETGVLASLRSSLRERARSSPLMDEKQFVLDLELAYRAMWREWCEGGSPPAQTTA